ncbi:type II toxin-antitoxin system HicA family toxin [Pontibacter silvestris]|uniref:Type II toxin-antitoxin system HicA family toxin n=1 Tax=Pontibacter silvestris TaxID=2305183 RepID=A0ABW4WWM8_9BACT|nr:type II toxin-antitoxin system HicA family toxin [Pontibacter silvestris]MCC9138860.1 type II toxin-antitoxin system HicA family toxin [Pontibacter silvestris]
MSRKDKLKARLCSKPKDFTYQELVTLLTSLGFELEMGPGSSRKFYNPETQQTIYLHQPHPGNILKGYILKDVIKVLGIC